MAEYIGREAAKHELLSGAVCVNHPEYLMKDDALHVIDSIPAADVAPVRHGRWEVGYFHDRVCSCCLHPDNDFDDYAHKFCPHCGAIMDNMEA